MPDEPQFDLFGHGPMSRRSDPITSLAAAAVVEPIVNKLQGDVLKAFSEHGDMTARTAERLDEFVSYGFSTIRKRISELAQRGYLAERGIDQSLRAPSIIYGIPLGCRRDDASQPSNQHHGGTP